MKGPFFMLKLTCPDGTPISSWEEWTRPKRDYQWKEGRSAMELAKSWFRNSVPAPPPELLDLLNSHDRTKEIQFVSGTPEKVTRLPERGHGRNHDLALIGHTDAEQITVCIEAKADEPFGSDSVLDYYNKALEKRAGGISTRAPERIEALLAMIDPGISVYGSRWKDVRYQLITALCGTILQAIEDGSSLGVFVIHEFRTSLTNERKMHDNHQEFGKFFKNFEVSCCGAGKLCGQSLNPKKAILIGKVVSNYQC
jgi:hypothetical protein